MKYYIGLDLGTTGCKSAVFDQNFNILGESYLEYPIINKSSEKIEQDANLWWDLSSQSIMECLKNANVTGSDINALSVSSQGIAFVPVDKNLNAIHNAISWLDKRPKKETQTIRKKISDKEIFKITGKRITPAYTLPKIMWIKTNKPKLYKQTFKFLMPHDFLIAKLTGKTITDRTMASGTLMYDIVKNKWSDKLLDLFNVSVEKLPSVVISGKTAGYVTCEAAKKTGLSTETKIISGGQDQKCAALGAGIKNNIATVSLGTATAIISKYNKPVIGKEMKIPCFSDILDKKWVLEGVIGTSGICYKWYRNTFFNDLSYKQLDKWISSSDIKTNDVFFYPYLTGPGSPNWYEQSKGIFYGMNLSTTKQDMTASVIEGITFQIKSNLDYMETDDKLDEIRVFGGGAKSNIWCQIIADVTGKKVHTLFTAETACLGAAIIAAGRHNNTDLDIKTGKKYYPDPKKVSIYQNKYKEYIKTEERIMR